MRTFLSSENPQVPPRCVEVRRLLEDFAARRLGPSARGAVEAHLLTCDECSGVMADMLTQQVATGELPLLTSPSIPSPAVYETYLRAREPELSWRRVIEGMSDSNAATTWVESRLNEIRAGFAALVNPEGGALRPRGAPVRVLVADLLTPTGGPSGTTVSFQVSSPPVITADRRFQFEVTTKDVACQGRRLLCTIALPTVAPVVFEAVIVATAETGNLSARFDDEALPVESCSLPIASISLSIF